MPQSNDPQIKRPSDANTPMISGRGTKIIVSARGAYEARNLPALFDAMDADQQTLFRVAVIVEMMDRIRHDIEQAAESRPEMLETLNLLAQWVFEPTQANADALYAPYLDDRVSELDPLTYRLRGLVLAAIYPRHNAIGYAKDALLYIPDDDVPQQPHYAIMESEIEDWIFEVGWAILHGRNSPPLNVDAVYIEALIGNVEHWYRKKDLPLLSLLMDDNQRESFKQAIRQQAMWHVDKVPVGLWSGLQLGLLELMRGWLNNPPAASEVEYHSLNFAPQLWNDAAARTLRALLNVFSNTSDEGEYHNVVPTLLLYVTRMTSGDLMEEPFNAAIKHMNQWQLDAAYAILTDQPIPSLE